ncbi:MAG: DUF2442 domain-containing protein [Acetobacteraceae bacterium]|jgi:hypothetical protein
MPSVLDNVITAAVADPETYTVTVTWATGDTTVNRFNHLIGNGIFARLADPTVFMQVGIGEHGRSLEWPGEIDFCADALWFETHPAEAPHPPQHAAS